MAHSPRRGFTLIELTIVVAIIAVLAAIAIPMYGNMVTRSKESVVKGQLGSLRSALAVYYADNDGMYPSSLTAGLIPGGNYLQQLPLVFIPPVILQSNPGHDLNNVESVTAQTPCPPVIAENPSQIWAYDAADNPCEGRIYLQCTHFSVEGSPWTSY
jgi:prepilin-type N-terminal cleavage/methylation domain-containing protein